MFLLVKRADEQQAVKSKQNTLSCFLSKLNGYGFDEHFQNHDLWEVLRALGKEYWLLIVFELSAP